MLFTCLHVQGLRETWACWPAWLIQMWQVFRVTDGTSEMDVECMHLYFILMVSGCM